MTQSSKAQTDGKQDHGGKPAEEGTHWASPGLPPPPVNEKKQLKGIPSKSGLAENKPGEEPADRRDDATDEWIKDVKVENTQSGD